MAPLWEMLLGTLFLLTFAYDRGVGELRALFFDVGPGASESVCLRVIPVFVAWSVLAGVAPRSFVAPSLDFWLGFDQWNVFCALYGHCGGCLGSPLGRVRSVRCFCIAPYAAWVALASLIV